MRRLLLIASIFASSAHANVVGNGLQNFNSITSGIDFVTVNSSETLKPGLINLGLFFNQAVNSLPYLDNTTQGRTNFNDTVLGMDMNLGVGLGENWDFGLSFPYILRQTVESNNQTHGEFVKNGNLEIRLNTKYRLWGDEQGGFALVGTVNFDRTTNNPYLGNSPGPTYNLEGAWDTTIDKWALGFNLGYRKPSPGTPVANAFIDPIGDQWIAGVGTSYLLPRVDTKLIFEVFGSLPAQNRNSNTDRSASSLELLGGVKHDFNTNLAGHVGGGTELMHGTSSPDWRVYVGLNYTFGPVFERSAGDDFRAEKTQTEERWTMHNILFDFDSDKMVGNFAEVLAELAQKLKQISYRRLTIVGHTDSIGAEAYNEQLSLKRAEAIRKYLIGTHGIKADMLDAQGKGESQPIADNGNFQGRQENRRVEFLIQK